MSERAAGERARWLAAVLIVASIAATSVIVRFWHVDTPAPAPVLASRHIHLYQAPVVPSPATNLPAPASPARPVRLRPERTMVVAVRAPVPTPVPTAVSADLSPAPEQPEVSSLVAESVPDAVTVPEPPAAVDVVASVDVPLVEAAAAPLPVTSSSSRGIVEMPAVAVTRAVTIAGRGIMTGLRATGAILRAPF